jgi:hypothetical protein
MKLEWPESRAMRGAVTGVAVAALVFLVAVVDAIRVDSTDVQPPPDLLRAPAGLTAPPAGSPVHVAGDPFAADGELPAVRYRLPGDEPAGVEGVQPEVLPEVLGTAVATEGRSFAMVRLGTASPKVLFPGDTIGTFTVKTVERGVVTFTRASGELLTVRTSALFIRS